MKPTSSRLIVLVLSMLLGVAVSFLFASCDASNRSIPPVQNSPVVDGSLYLRVNFLVISIPKDGEFYIGKRLLKPSQIGEAISRSLNYMGGARVLYVKSAAKVKFETLALVITEAKRLDIDRIEFVLDKKKVGYKNQ
jgi:biopolymer transport protein ExbD